MAIRVSGVHLALDEPETALPEHLGRILALAPGALGPWRILRKSLDARDKDRLRFVYTVAVSLPEDEDEVVAPAPKVKKGRQAANTEP